MKEKTKEKWIVGMPKEGITGPTVPSVSGPTCGEVVEFEQYYKDCEDEKNPEYPSDKHKVVTCGKEVVAIIPTNGSREGKYVARLVAKAPELLELCEEVIEYLEWREDFVIEDAEEGNKNIYAKLTDAIKEIKG